MTTTANEYTKQADDFAESVGLSIDWEYIGHERPRWNEKERPPVAHFRFTMKREGRPSYSADYYDSVHDSYEASEGGQSTWRYMRPGSWAPVPPKYLGKVEAGSRRTLDSALTEAAKGGTVEWAGIVLRRRTPKPTAYDLLACVEKNDPGTLEEWCGDLGYNPDSKRDTETYLAVIREYQGVRRMFSDEELERLQAIQ